MPPPDRARRPRRADQAVKFARIGTQLPAHGASKRRPDQERMFCAVSWLSIHCSSHGTSRPANGSEKARALACEIGMGSSPASFGPAALGFYLGVKFAIGWARGRSKNCGCVNWSAHAAFFRHAGHRPSKERGVAPLAYCRGHPRSYFRWVLPRVGKKAGFQGPGDDELLCFRPTGTLVRRNLDFRLASGFRQ